VEWGTQLHPYLDKPHLLVSLVLIYAKNVPQLFNASVEPAVRVGILRAVLEGVGEVAAGAQERLLRLVRNARDVVATSLPPDVQRSVDAFHAAVPVWATPTAAWLFQRDGVQGCDVYRAQLSGNCFMHAPNVVLHYVVCKHRRPAVASLRVRVSDHLKEMVDLTAYVLKYFDGRRLWEYVYEDSGGDSIAFLQELGVLEDDDVIEARAVSMSEAVVMSRLEEHGPALIARFKTFDEFNAADSSYQFIGCHKTAASTRGLGQHAMALVGWRRIESGEVRFLVQNWWKSMQFFECDLLFLQSRGATLVWVTKKLTELPSDRPMTTSSYAECVDCRDRCPDERRFV
jgi:hypothetical protein